MLPYANLTLKILNDSIVDWYTSIFSSWKSLKKEFSTHINIFDKHLPFSFKNWNNSCGFFLLLFVIQWVTWQMSYKRQALLILRENQDSPPVFGRVLVAHHFSLLCCVVFIFELWLVCPQLPMSLDCPFLIAPSVFSFFYLTKNNNNSIFVIWHMLLLLF